MTVERLRRAALSLCVLALTLVCPVAAQRAAPEAVLVELQLGRIAGRTVEAYRVGGAALVPLSHFLDLAEIRATRRPDGGVEATVQPGNVPLMVCHRCWRRRPAGRRQASHQTVGCP